MTEPKRPCEGCKDKRPIFTDGADFWKWDPSTELYRMVDFSGGFYSNLTHPGATEQRLVGMRLMLATEIDIIWRTVHMIVGGLTQADVNF